MELHSYNKKGLEALVHAEAYQAMKDVPISLHRAISHLHNPRAEEKDILLITAIENGQLIGYVGMLPDVFHLNGQTGKIAWLSCLWVHPEARGKSLALILMKQAFLEWDDRILLTEFAEEARSLYLRSGLYVPFYRKAGIRLFLRSCLAEVLPPKHRFFALVKPLLGLLDSGINFFLPLKKSPPAGLFPVLMDHFDASCSQFIARRQGGELFARNTEELNWMLDFPWVFSAPVKDATANRYYFSSTDRHFSFLPFRFNDAAGNLRAVVLLSRRNNHLKVLYAYADPGDMQQVATEILRLAQKEGCNRLTTFHPGFTAYYSQAKLPVLFKKSLEREFLLSARLAPGFTAAAIEIAAGDGDAAFT